MKVISMSSPTNSVMWRWVNEFSEEDGATSNALGSPISAICLHAGLREVREAVKVLDLEDVGAALDAVPTSLGEWISVKPWPRRKPRKSLHTPDWMRMIAWFAGVRRSSTRLFSRTSWMTRGRASPPAAAAAASAASSAAVGSGRAARPRAGAGAPGRAADAEDLLDLQLDELLRARRDRHVGARHLGATSTTDSFGSAPAKATTEASPPTTACTVWICWRSWRR